MKEENLIFIVSQPRAGSTYLQNLLSNNKETNTCSEPWILLNHLNTIKPSLVRTKTDHFLARGAFNNYSKNFPSLDYDRVFKEYLLRLYEPILHNYTFVLDKTPRYWEILDEIIKLFPKSKIIVLHRNPLEIAKSLIKTWDLSTFKELNLFRRDLLLAPKRLNDFCKKQSENPNIYSIHYKDLLLNTENEMKDIYKWCGLKYSEEVMNVNSNQKYKGEYGDPLQNTLTGYSEAKEMVDKNELKKEFVSFLQGYANFLGQDFLNEYGNYQLEGIEIRKTLAFDYFLHLGEDNDRSFSSQKDLIWMIKDFIYKLKFK